MQDTVDIYNLALFSISITAFPLTNFFLFSIFKNHNVNNLSLADYFDDITLAKAHFNINFIGINIF
jgi:hypothetical protein